MIRLIQRRLIVPRGDTGTFSIPVLAGKDTGDASVFTIFNPLTHRKIFEKVMQLSDGVLTMDLSHGDTVNLPVGQFVWDIKFYTNPTIADGHIVDGEEVDSYYAAFTLPVCEIRETGDNLLLSDEAPQATLSPGQIDYITASINEVTDSKNAAASSAAEADVSATNAETSASAAAVSEQAAQDSQEAALVSQQAAQTAAEQAIASAEAAAETAAHIEADLESKANIADLDDVAFSGDYNDLSNKPNIPTRISDLTDDSGHYIKPVTGIPASDLEETYLTSFIETDPTVPGWAKQAQKPTYTAQEVGAPTIQEMNTALASKLDNKFLVIFTPDPESQDTVMSYICDKTMEEIIAADEAGKLVEGRLIINNNSMQMEYNLTYTKMNAQIQGMSLKSLVFYLQINGSIITISGSPLETNGKWETKIATLLQGDLENTYNAENKRLINLSTPTNDKDAANKKYVDDTVAAFTETDPTVPSWAKAQTKPTYTASEVGAPTVAEMNTAIGTAIGNVHQFELSIVQELPTQDIDTHTIYLVPKTGETNDIYDEYIYINNAWEMIGNTQIDLSNYATKNEIPNVPVQDVQVNGNSVLNNGIANIPVADDPPVVPIFTESNNVWSCNMTFSEVMSALQANNCDGCLINGSLFVPVTYYYDDPYEGNIQFSCVDMLGTNKFIMKMITYMVGEHISYFERQSNTLDALAKEYSSSDSSIFPVSIGDYYVYNGKLYRANTAIQTAESFRPAKWDEVKVTGELNNLKNDLAAKLNAAEAGLKVVRLI